MTSAVVASAFRRKTPRATSRRLRALLGMKLRILLLAIGAAAVCAPVHAQDVIRRPLIRADTWAGLGWHHARLAEAGEYDDWYHRSLSGTAGAAWYWTDHLRTEIDIGATSGGQVFVSGPVLIDGQPAGRYGFIRQRTRTLGLTQHYQFFRNAWFHPYIGAGLDVVHETKDERFEALQIFDPFGRSRIIEPAQEESSRRFVARPAASFGFKAYLSPRAYFRSDARIGVRTQIEDVIVRFGFGVDF
jgi:hypothetical protein